MVCLIVVPCFWPWNSRAKNMESFLEKYWIRLRRISECFSTHLIVLVIARVCNWDRVISYAIRQRVIGIEFWEVLNLRLTLYKFLLVFFFFKVFSYLFLKLFSVKFGEGASEKRFSWLPSSHVGWMRNNWFRFLELRFKRMKTRNWNRTTASSKCFVLSFASEGNRGESSHFGCLLKIVYTFEPALLNAVE